MPRTDQEFHGKSKTQEYRLWTGIISRCYNPRHTSYPRYGGRGISVCDRWRSFSAFISDMGTRPSPDHQIERLDNSGNYTPENCCWVTRTQQGRNKRNSRLLTKGNQTKTLAEWCEVTGLASCTILMRLRYGWTVDDALTKPLRGKLAESDIPTIRSLLAQGNTAISIARKYGVSRSAIKGVKTGENWSHVP